MHRLTKSFQVLQSSDRPMALDMGMAPGGFSATILQHYPSTKVRAITLPHADGGHAVQLRHNNLNLELKDINTMAGDLGILAIPASRSAYFNTKKTIPDSEKYDVIVCGGQVTRNQEREEWRERREARRLELAQLIIAMEHIKPHGTIILVLHKPESFFTAETLFTFSSFSNLTLFKPRKAHAKRSSFYMIAKAVKPADPIALRMVKDWREEWEVATLRTDEEYRRLRQKTVEDAEKLMADFGDRLIKLGNPIWKTQAMALRKAPFIKGS